MRFSSPLLLLCLWTASALPNPSSPTLPLAFEPNRGQSDPQVQYLARGRAFTAFLTSSETVLVSESSVLRMRLVHARARTVARGLERLPGNVNYLGHPGQTDIPTYAKARLRGIYPGIDLVYYGNQDQLEYDFVVGPHADPKRIRLHFEGADDISVNSTGELILRHHAGEFRWLAPVAYQEIRGRRVGLKSRYLVSPAGEVSFAVSNYDPALTLTIDPILSYSTSLPGGSGPVMAIDMSGNAYFAGTTTAPDFPSAAIFMKGSAVTGANWIYISKLNAAGSALLYSSLIYNGVPTPGFTSGGPFGIGVDNSGNVVAAGFTEWPALPVVNAFQPAAGGDWDSFILKLNSAGNALQYLTYLGGSGADEIYALALDSAGAAYVTGFTSGNFPLRNAFQPVRSPMTLPYVYTSFVSKIGSDGSLVYSSYIGPDRAYGIALDAAGAAYITGTTGAATFFNTANGAQPAFGGGGGDSFLAKISPDGRTLVYGTYLGRTDDDGGTAVAVDAAGNVYVAGTSSGLASDFPLRNAFQTEKPGALGGTLTKFDSAGHIVYSTYLGGKVSTPFNPIGIHIGAQNFVRAVRVGASGRMYVAGTTSATDFPLKDPLQATYGGGAYDGFIIAFQPDGKSLFFSTFLGGSDPDDFVSMALDVDESVYVSGRTNLGGGNGTFPTTPGALQKAIPTAGDLGILLKVVFEHTFAAAPGSLSFTATQGGSAPAHQTVTVSAPDFVYGFQSAVTSVGSWLSVNPKSGTTPGALDVTVSPAGLAAGSYAGAIQISAAGAANSPLVVNVQLNVLPPLLLTGAGPLNAASLLPGPIAPDELTVLNGSNLSQTPSVTITDSAGVQSPVTVQSLSSGQITILIPSGVAPGPATIAFTTPAGVSAAQTVQVSTVAPGIFTADGTGQGAPDATIVHVSPDGSQRSEPAFVCTDPNSCTPAPIDLGPDGDVVLLQLSATGVRHRSDLTAVVVSIGGESADVYIAGAMDDPGKDQIVCQIPRDLAGSGQVQVQVTVDGNQANPVLIDMI